MESGRLRAAERREWGARWVLLAVLLLVAIAIGGRVTRTAANSGGTTTAVAASDTRDALLLPTH